MGYAEGGADGTDPTWDPLKGRRGKVAAILAGLLASRLMAGADDTITMMDEALAAGADEGFLLALWQLETSGADTSDAAESRPDAEAWQTLLAASGYGGLSYADRARNWIGEGFGKVNTWLTAAVVGGLTLGDTLLGVDNAFRTMVGRIETLGREEMALAYTTSAQVAWQPFRPMMAGEVWITMRDERVCSICGPLHMKITDLSPIRDSHPLCRCAKIPILQDYEGRILDFGGYRQEYTLADVQRQARV